MKMERSLACVLIAGIVLLIGCTPMPTPAATEAPTEAWYEATEEAPAPVSGGYRAPPGDVEPEEDAEVPAVDDRDGSGGQGNVLPAAAGAYRVNRLIIKDAMIRLLVRDTDVAVDRATQVVADVGGYIISSHVWHEDMYGEAYKYATMTIGVPVDRFERALQRLRDLAVEVVDEQASGEDVTDEYVDLQSRLDNLTATRDRIRLFLDQAETVEEALLVNEELAAIEEQIETVQGRMNYLFDRASYSTITIEIEPEATPPTPTPTYTPSPTSTPTPTPTPTPWSLSPTVESAGRTLGSIVRGLVEFLTWTGIVLVPLVAPIVLGALGVRALLRRGKRRKTGSAAGDEGA